MVAVETQVSGLCVVMSDQIPMEAAATSNTTSAKIKKEYKDEWVEAILKYKIAKVKQAKRCEAARKEIGISGYDIYKELDKLIELYEL